LENHNQSEKFLREIGWLEDPRFRNWFLEVRGDSCSGRIHIDPNVKVEFKKLKL